MKKSLRCIFFMQVTIIIGSVVLYSVLAQTLNGAESPVNNDGANKCQYEIPRRLCSLRNNEIDESSGLAVSRRRDGIYWTHNDSGGAAALYAFDSKGNDLSRWKIRGATNRDWEDMASFSIDGRPVLVVGEIGDNFERWGTYKLYFVEEPELPLADDDSEGAKEATTSVAASGGKNQVLDPLYTLTFRYEDGNHNCEAIAVDPERKEILLITKTSSLFGEAGVYRIALPELSHEKSSDTASTQAPAAPPLPPLKIDDSLRLDSGPKVATARKIATLSLPMVTAMDISADGHEAIVLTYGNAYYYHRDASETWSIAFARPPVEVTMPVRLQGESIGFGTDGKSLYLTSEKLPVPLWHLPPAKVSE